MNEIVQNIVNGKLTRDNDEKYAGGLWDYAGEIIRDSENPCDEKLQADIYYALWAVVDELNRLLKELK